ncbi:MAG: hypothetical protein HDS42_07685 [Bacteroides sp.]|nr:hypothetical protein [Bacteroides sp.]
MIKRIFLYIALMMSLAACSDDIFNSPTESLPADGKLTISFAVPEMNEPKTRAVYEDKLDHVKMLVFKDGELGQIIEINDPNSAQTITINENLRRSNLYFLFIANSGINDPVERTPLNDIRTRLVKDVIGGDYMVMSGAATLQDLLKLESVNMFRNAAKVTVTEERNDESGKPAGANYPFAVYGSATQSPVMAGASNGGDNSFLAVGNPSPVNAFDKALSSEPIYIHPTDNTGTNENKAYVIVKAPYNGQEYYYRLNLQNKEGETLDLLPNYWYDIRILDNPRTAGYATPAEAAKNPVAFAEEWFEIHDHAPVIYNIISDGSRELGVSHILRRLDTDSGTEEMFVKVYSKEDSSEEAKENINITFADSWLEVDKIEEATDEEAGAYGDSDTKGTVYKVTVRFKDTNNTGLLTSECNVSWKGLTRVVPVEWDRTFDPSKLFKSVKLTIKNGQGVNEAVIDDYFKFISENVWGATKDANCGEARDLGFHFPLQYGEDNALWTYEYEIELNDLVPNESYTWGYEIRGDAAISGKVALTNANNSTLQGAGPKFTLTRPAAGWEYGVGELVIKVGDASYTIDLYHTGFFHKDYITKGDSGIGLASKDAPAEGKEYTYYEVVSMGNNHWLDRNLGAHSAEMFVKTSTGTTYAGDPEAAGGYYRVAGYVKYGKPEMKDAICPPGYTYPTQEDFTAVRGSANFFTGMVGNYYTAAYSADMYDRGAKRKTVYFPKSIYIGSDNQYAGESRAGYYWTRTPASGSEKEEIGAWLRAFNLSGEATSFVNGEVFCSYESTKGNSTRTSQINGYAMNVRCVRKTNDNSTPQATNFFVSGATHVYLYTQSADGSRIAVTAWPGISIGAYNTVATDHNFLYESAVNTPDKLYVIFNYVDKAGKIHSLSKDVNNTKEARYTDKISPADLQGWGVIEDDAPNWIDYGNSTITTAVMNLDGSGNEWYWRCDFDAKKAGFYEPAKWDGNTYRIYVLKHADFEGKEHNAFNSWWIGASGMPGKYMLEGEKSPMKKLVKGSDIYYYFDFDNTPANSFKYQIVYGASPVDGGLGYNGGDHKPADGTEVSLDAFLEADCDGKIIKCFTIRGWANDANYGGAPK